MLNTEPGMWENEKRKYRVTATEALGGVTIAVLLVLLIVMLSSCAEIKDTVCPKTTAWCQEKA